ncbi:MAG TPA: threonylcarbamoyl-AMP synthase [bacterium]|nr:threonylcarbamoyl-AMP synthase [bacterium]
MQEPGESVPGISTVRAFSQGWEQRSADVLRRGGIVIYPTETVYGLGCDPFNPKAVRRLKRMKGDKKPVRPFLILVPDALFAESMAAEVSDTARRLMQECWPGPLTLIFKASSKAPEPVMASNRAIAMRVSSDPVCRSLTSAFGPLVSTSANLSGKEPAFRAVDAACCFAEKADLVIDDGDRGSEPPSTLVDVTSARPRILRQGAVKCAFLLDLIRVEKGVDHA